MELCILINGGQICVLRLAFGMFTYIYIKRP
jgi:hypothetical protein